MTKQTSLFKFFSKTSEENVLKEKPPVQNTSVLENTSKNQTPTPKSKSPISKHQNSSSKTKTPKRPHSTPKTKSVAPKQRKTSVSDTTKHVSTITIEDNENAKTMEEDEVDENGKEDDSPVLQRKRRRVQIVESDSEEEMEVGGGESPPNAAKRTNLAKLSREHLAKINARQPTPYVKKADIPESHSEEDWEGEEDNEVKIDPSLIKSVSGKLSKFGYKKRNTARAKHNVSPIKFSPSSPKSETKSPIKKQSNASPQDSKNSVKIDIPVKSPKSEAPSPKPQKEDAPTRGSPKTQEKPKAIAKAPAMSSSMVAYDPTKAGYDPREDASWVEGQAVPYAAVAATLQVAPAYAGIELGVGEGVVMKAIGEACGINPAKLKSKMNDLGDLGSVAETSRSKQKMMIKPKPLIVTNVFKTFFEIATMTGNQSQNHKIGLIKRLLVSCEGCEARYITRSLLGKLRVGLAEQTVLVALAHATLLTPPGNGDGKPGKGSTLDAAKADAALAVKTCYCEHPDYEHVIRMIKEHGVMGAQEFCGLSPGVPVKPMLAHPTKGISEVLHRFSGCEFTCEYKYDGERAQIQRTEDGKVSIFSRNQENNTSKYPDIIDRIGSCMGGGTTSFILDCEVVAWNTEEEKILPFQILTTRKRKDADKDDIKVKVCLFGFDLLYLNGESLVRKSFRERRSLLHSAFTEVKGEFVFATSRDCSDTEEIQEFLEESIRGQCEGLMVKTLDRDATYEIAKRSHNWLKVKKDYLEGVADSLDLVVLGAFAGKGKRSGLYGGYLLGCYDPDAEEYQAICKIGTGFTDEDLAAHYKALSEHIIPQPKTYYAYPETVKPDVWFEPSVVWEVKCADLSVSPVYPAAVGVVDPDKGISLRFPRFIRVRDDKSAEDATSSEQVADLYQKQDNKQAIDHGEGFY